MKDKKQQQQLQEYNKDVTTEMETLVEILVTKT